MRIISPTKLQKKKLKEIILKVFPEYQYVSLRKDGIIFLSKSIWHYFIGKYRETCVTEICTVFIPEKLNELRTKTFEGEYHPIYNTYSHIVLELLHHRSGNVIDYLYDEYIHIKYGLEKAYYVKNNILPETSTYTLKDILSVKTNGLVLSKLSNVELRSQLKRWKDSASILKHPILLSRTLDLWFKDDIREFLKRYYPFRGGIAFSPI